MMACTVIGWAAENELSGADFMRSAPMVDASSEGRYDADLSLKYPSPLDQGRKAASCFKEILQTPQCHAPHLFAIESTGIIVPHLGHEVAGKPDSAPEKGEPDGSPRQGTPRGGL